MKKFGILLLVALAVILLLNSFKGGGNSPKLIIHQTQTVTPTNNNDSTNPKDIDVMAYCASLGIPTSVNEAEIIERFGQVELSIDFNEKVSFSFRNEGASYYMLDIYDMEGNPVLTITHINNNNIAVDAGFFAAGEYIYKLSGNGNIFAGKFSY